MLVILVFILFGDAFKWGGRTDINESYAPFKLDFRIRLIAYLYYPKGQTCRKPGTQRRGSSF